MKLIDLGTIKYLGAWLDQELKMKQHIVNKCRSVMLNIQRIKHLRPLLREDITQVLVIGLVILHIDYCNSLFVGLPETEHFQTTENTKCWCQTGTQ